MGSLIGADSSEGLADESGRECPATVDPGRSEFVDGTVV